MSSGRGPGGSCPVATKTACSPRLHCSEWSCVVLIGWPRHRIRSGRDWPVKSRCGKCTRRRRSLPKNAAGVVCVICNPICKFEQGCRPRRNFIGPMKHSSHAHLEEPIRVPHLSCRRQVPDARSAISARRLRGCVRSGDVCPDGAHRGRPALPARGLAGCCVHGYQDKRLVKNHRSSAAVIAGLVSGQGSTRAGDGPWRETSLAAESFPAPAAGGFTNPPQVTNLPHGAEEEQPNRRGRVEDGRGC